MQPMVWASMSKLVADMVTVTSYLPAGRFRAIVSALVKVHDAAINIR